MKTLLAPLALCAAVSLLAAAPTPSPAPSPQPSPHPSATHTPAPPKDVEETRVGISGVWEIALQAADGVTYTHFKLTQAGTALTGQYLDESGKKFPLAGSISGKNVRVVVSMPDGTALVFTGTVDGDSDMIGTLTTAKTVIGFTAAYRPKYKWIDSLAPGTGGLGGGTGVPGGVPLR